MKTVLDILIAGRELISDPSRWTQGAAARDDRDNMVGEGDAVAVCWCSVGALYKTAAAEGSAYEDAYGAMMASLSLIAPDGGLANFNDTHTHSEVLALWERAIDAERNKLENRMNKQNAHLFLPLVQALAEGLPIQYHVGGDCWQDEPNPSFAQLPERYRVAPNPYQHLIDALNAGKVVQVKSGTKWLDCNITARGFEASGLDFLKGKSADYSPSYRIKSDEPKTIWVNEYVGGFSAHEKEEHARCTGSCAALRVAVKYVEVNE